MTNMICRIARTRSGRKLHAVGRGFAHTHCGVRAAGFNVTWGLYDSTQWCSSCFGDQPILARAVVSFLRAEWAR
jgi:hypothetical protein